jgi:lipopolysaccharide biosynthesis glycosyltransferase
LFAFGILPGEVERILYVDSDTIITGAVFELADFDLGGCVTAMRSIYGHERYKKHNILLGIPEEEPWFNGGVMVVDIEKWKQEKVFEALMESFETCQILLNDEHMLNRVLYGRIAMLPSKFNDNINRENTGGTIGGMEKRLKEKDIRILHFGKYFGERPWNKNSLHPVTPLFDKYLALSPWRDMQKDPPRRFMLRLFKTLYMVFPKVWVMRLFGIGMNIEADIRDAKIVRKNRGLAKTG